jgi:hypothetical protein
MKSMLSFNLRWFVTGHAFIVEMNGMTFIKLRTGYSINHLIKYLNLSLRY